MKSRGAIYIRAARLIESGEETFSCSAVDVAAYDFHTLERELYAQVMSPRSGEGVKWHGLLIGDIAGAVRDSQHYPSSCKMREFRVWLLCMMAAAYEDLV